MIFKFPFPYMSLDMINKAAIFLILFMHLISCLSVFIALKGTLKTVKTFIGSGLHFQKVNPLPSWQEPWLHAGRHGAVEQRFYILI